MYFQVKSQSNEHAIEHLIELMATIEEYFVASGSKFTSFATTITTITTTTTTTNTTNATTKATMTTTNEALKKTLLATTTPRS